MDFSRQEYWSGLPFPSPGDLPDPGIELGSPALQTGAFTIWATRKPPKVNLISIKHSNTNMIHSDSESCSVLSYSLRPHGLYSPWNYLGQNTGVGSLSFSRGSGSNLGIEPRSHSLQVDSLPAAPQGKLSMIHKGSLICGVPWWLWDTVIHLGVK